MERLRESGVVLPGGVFRMDEMLVDLAVSRSLDYLERAGIGVNLAARATHNEIAEGYLRLAQCWSKLAAVVQNSGAGEKRDAA